MMQIYLLIRSEIQDWRCVCGGAGSEPRATTLGGSGGSTHGCMSTPCPRQLAGGCQFSPFLRFLLKQLDLSESIVVC